jgi:two-component sensor histidine kinase
MTRLRISLRGRLLILTVVALAPAIGLLAWTQLQLRRARSEEVRELAARYGQLASLDLVRIVDGTESLMLAVAQAPVVAGQQGGDCDAYLARVVADAPQLAAIGSFDRDLTPECVSQRHLPDLSADNRALLTQATPGALVIGTYQTDPAGGHKILPLLMAVHDPPGGSSRFLVAYLDLGWLGDRIKERGLGAENSLTISDRNGIIIAREPFPDRFVGTRIPPAFDRLIHAEAPGTEDVISQDGTRRMLGYYPVTVPPIGIYISAGVSDEEAFRAIDATRAHGFALVLAASLLTFALAWMIGQRFIQRPVDHLLTCIQAWLRGDLAVRTGMRAQSGELESVGEAFDRLIDELGAREAARERSETQRQLLVGELTHRVKNTLALVQAIAVQSLRGSGEFAISREKFLSRLRALAESHDVLTSNDWEAAELHDVLDRTLRPYRDGSPDRFGLSGPKLLLQPRAALAVAMAVHELATNAVKYGALSTERGQVRIAWAVDEAEAEPHFRLTWLESGGPLVTAPERSGFGSRLIRGAFGTELHGTARMEYAPEGLICHVDVPLASIAAELAST